MPRNLKIFLKNCQKTVNSDMTVSGPFRKSSIYSQFLLEQHIYNPLEIGLLDFTAAQPVTKINEP